MKQSFAAFVVVAGFIAAIVTCSKIPSDALFQPVKFKPTITASLDSSQHVLEGQTLTLAVSAKGTAPFSYVLYDNNDSIGASAGDSFSIQNIQLSQAGTYKVIVTNDYGKDSSETIVAVDSLFYNIAVSHDGKGAVSPVGTNGVVKVRPLAIPVFTYTPDSGNYVDSVIVNGANLPAYTERFAVYLWPHEHERIVPRGIRWNGFYSDRNTPCQRHDTAQPSAQNDIFLRRHHHPYGCRKQGILFRRLGRRRKRHKRHDAASDEFQQDRFRDLCRHEQTVPDGFFASWNRDAQPPGRRVQRGNACQAYGNPESGVYVYVVERQRERLARHGDRRHEFQKGNYG